MHLRQSSSFTFAAISFAILHIGCSRDVPLRASVSGLVTMDGRPVDEGQIMFYPNSDTKGPAAGGPIKLGRYKIKQMNGPTVGQNLVQILAYKTTGPPQTQSFGKNRPRTPEDMYKIWGKRPIFFDEPEGSMEVVIETGKNEFDFSLKETKNE